MAEVALTLPVGTITESGRLGFPVALTLPVGLVREMGGLTLTPYVYVVDSGNNRVVATDYDGNFKFSFGSYGSGNGQFNNPYGIDSDGTYLYVTDTGNNRVQKFTLMGVYVSQWGAAGTGDGQFAGPMGIAVDSRFAYVVDNGNNRFQIFDTGTGGFFYKLGTYGSGKNQFNNPTGITDDDYFIYIDDTGNSRTVTYAKNWELGTYLSASLPAMSVAFETDISMAVLDAALPSPLTVEMESTLSMVMTLDADLPGINSDFSSLLHFSAVLDAALPDTLSDIEASIGMLAVLDAALPGVIAELTAISNIDNTLNAELPRLATDFSTFLTSATPVIHALVMNTLSKAVSEYTGFAFDSFSRFAGTYLATGTINGVQAIFELEGGNNDNGLNIAAMLQTGDRDLHHGSKLQQMNDVHVHLISGADMKMTFVWNRDANKTYVKTIPGSGDSLPHIRRVKPGRGVKKGDRIYSLKLENQDGEDFELEQIAVDTTAVGREMHV